MCTQSRAWLQTHKQRGQAITEYILLIVVILAIGTALLYRLSTPVQHWMKFYIGDYIDCLLDQGELPQILGSGPKVTNCDYTAITSGTNGSGSTQGNPESTAEGESGNNSNGKDVANSNQDPAGRNLAEGDEAAKSGNTANSRRRRSRSFRVRGNGGADGYPGLGGGLGKRFTLNSAGAADLNTDNDSNTGKNQLDGPQGKNKQTQRATARFSRKVRVRGLGGYVLQDADSNPETRALKKVNQRRISVNKEAPEAEGFGPTKPKQFTSAPPKPKREMASDDKFSFSFGQVIRFAFIVMVVVMVAWIIGSQLVQARKNLE
jgi:hypothetical protein